MIDKATPTATLAVNNSPVTYDGTAKAATVAITVSSVPGAVANILTGGAATQTGAGTYAVTADFVPTDTANYNSLLAQAAGSFVIDKATPTATLAVNNSPVTYDGTAKAATVAITVSSVPGAVANTLTGGAATQTGAGTYAVTADFVPTDTANYNSLLAQAAGNFVIDKATPTATLAVNNSPVTYDGTAKAATVGDHGQFGAGRGGQHPDGRRGHPDRGGHLRGDGGLRADGLGQLQQPAGAGRREFRHREGQLGHCAGFFRESVPVRLGRDLYGHGDIGSGDNDTLRQRPVLYERSRV